VGFVEMAEIAHVTCRDLGDLTRGVGRAAFTG
jgi:hypothetical protein